ncbi:hypothetical protein [Mycobacterium sp. URHB0021]
MSRITTPADADFHAHPPLDAAAGRLGFVPTTHHALGAGHKALNTWPDSKKAMNAALYAANRQGGAHAVEEVNA